MSTIHQNGSLPASPPIDTQNGHTFSPVASGSRSPPPFSPIDEPSSLSASAILDPPKSSQDLSEATQHVRVSSDGEASLRSTRSSMDVNERLAQVEAELASTKHDKEVLSGQYRGLLGKLTAMRSTLGEKLKEDAVSCGEVSGTRS